MKSISIMKKDLLSFYKSRVNNGFINQDLNSYNNIIDNYDELFIDLLKELIDRKLNYIFINIERNMRVEEAIKLVDSGLDSIGIIDNDTALISLFKSYKYDNRDYIKDTIVNLIYNHFGIENDKVLKIKK